MHVLVELDIVQLISVNILKPLDDGWKKTMTHCHKLPKDFSTTTFGTLSALATSRTSDTNWGKCFTYALCNLKRFGFKM